MGVKNLDGIEGTDIFCKAGLLTTAMALPGLMGESTVTGLITPLMTRGLLWLAVGLKKSDRNASYWPGPGISG